VSQFRDNQFTLSSRPG